MNLVIIHYHLNKGGVTSVIRNHLHSILDDRPGKILVLHGSGMDGWSDSEFASNSSVHRICIESLGYRANQDQDVDIFGDIQSVLTQHQIDPANTLLHIHNHNLGKNNFLLPAIQEFVEKGFRLLLQIHDFAEDMRPANFQSICQFCQQNGTAIEKWLYPKSRNVHYAFLNHRDWELASRSIVDESNAHLLPNPLFLEPKRATDSRKEQIKNELGLSAHSKLIVYPVRAIRRKNVAEALLFSAVNKDSTIAVTLPAKSEDETYQYQALKKVAADQSLSMLFDVGSQGYDFHELMDAADYFFSSSITEGFGMTFLESWLWGKQLIGRNLKPITRDFVDAGLDLSSMYSHVRIPIEWIDIENEKKVQRVIFDEVASQFLATESTDRLLEKEQELGWIDFAKLSMATQRKVIALACGNESIRFDLLELNPMFSIPQENEELVQRNQNVVRTHFMSTAFRMRFESMIKQIEKVSQAESTTHLRKANCATLVAEFLDPTNFYPIRVQVQ